MQSPIGADQCFLGLCFTMNLWLLFISRLHGSMAAPSHLDNAPKSRVRLHLFVQSCSSLGSQKIHWVIRIC